MKSKHIPRRNALALALCLVAILNVLIERNNTQAAGSPNFVFILSDDQGWPATSVQMHPTRQDAKSDYFQTPNLERLASQAMRFSQGYAPAALCNPTRRSLQFGQMPVRQGSEGFDALYPVGNTHLTIPRLLKSVDPRYVAAHFGKWDHRTDLAPEHLGYDSGDGNTSNAPGSMTSTFEKTEKWSSYTVTEDPKRIFSITDRSLDFMMNSVKEERPFYLQISHYAVHVTMQTRRASLEKYKRLPKGEKHNVPAFGGMTEDLDVGVGKILDMIDELGIADSTYVIYMSDNGAAGWIPPNTSRNLSNPTTYERPGRNAPLRGGKWVTFEGGIRVPFIVRGPGVKPNSFCNVPVVGWDLLPTIADIVGYPKPLPGDLDGGSFRSLLENEGRGSVQRPNSGLVFHRYNDRYPHTSIRVGDYKLVKFWREDKMLLFNLENDLGETKDLVEAEPQKARVLHKQLMDYLESVDSDVLTLYK
ncbi:MAG: sulfatase [Verrucomicrobiia bacterium]|jgi:arylsulfatase A-like enzyme|tara:strand:- start:388 stop:1809 length:1422 start_codon:yes stop_codon:yes gene_type:complete